MNRLDTSRLLTSRVAWSASAALFLTVVHHVYGAYIYDTPWRLHAAIVSGIAGAAIGVLNLVVRRRSNDAIGVVAFWVFAVVTLLIPVLGIGFFEGWYNHVLKNVLYFADAPAPLLNRLFPPPTYELPDNVFFEMTGVMQVVPGTLTGWYLYRLLRFKLVGSVTSRSTSASSSQVVKA